MNRVLSVHRQWLLPAACLLAMPLAGAGAASGLPESAVLVLNVLSSTHARPATGLVVSTSAQVLVPAAFVGRGDQIVVLVDGTNLDRNALPTRTEARSVDSGLAVLSATGLNRAPFTLAAQSPRNGQQLRFIAFPAAEDLAQGRPPLIEEVKVVAQDGERALANPAALPRVNGALLDACGYLAGVVLNVEDPDDPAETDVDILWQPELRQALEALGVEGSYGDCGRPGRAAAENENAATEENPGGGPEILDRASLLPAQPDTEIAEPPVSSFSASTGADPVPAEPAAQSDPAMVEANAQEIAARDIPPAAAGDATTASNGQSRMGAAWALVLIVLAGIAGWWIGRRRGIPRTPSDQRLQQETGTGGARPQAPASGGTDALKISIRARFPGGHEEKLACQLDAAESLLLGRGQVELALTDDSLSKVHGRLQRSQGQLLYSDAGSDRGSWVDGIACLEGERFVVSDGSELVLGQVRLTLEFNTGQGRNS